MPPKRGRPPKTEAAVDPTIREEIQDLRAKMEKYFQRDHYVPPSPSHKLVAPPQPSQPSSKMPSPELGLTYWETLRFMKDLEMEIFAGSTDPIQADDWRKLLERNFESIRCPTEFKKDLAVHYLRGEARIWWESVVRNMPDGYEFHWETFRKEFDKKYLPQEAIDTLECRFLELRQGTKTVREYEQEFNRLRMFVARKSGEQSMIRRFMRGLRPDIRNLCSVREFDSMFELVEKAAMMEVGLEEEAKHHKSIENKTMNALESHKRTWDNRDVRYASGQSTPCARCGKRHGGVCWWDSGRCFQCGRVGHIRQNCPESIDRCRKCGQQGHHAKECLMQRVERPGVDAMYRPWMHMHPMEY